MNMYELRYTFECGSGVCLWAENDAARERYDFAVDHCDLPIGENTKYWLNYLIAWFDTSMDWDDCAQQSNHWLVDSDMFDIRAKKGFEMLVSDLKGQRYSIIDKTNK